MKARTRFAPSPTGFMHVGGVRTALFAWLVARQSGGEFILRIEDTDKQREVKGSESHIMESLAWLGLEWDEGPDKIGPNAPYRQSERLDTYKEWARKLIDSGRAYADPYSTEDLDKLRQDAKTAKRPFLFRDHRPDSPPVWDGSQPLRFKSDPKACKWTDAVLGDLATGPEVIDDFIILKSDGYPTYNFAHIIDDYLMEITHVIRSQEFLPSVPKFLNLYEALGIKPPVLATLPFVMGPDGKKKLSKRDGAKDILDYKKDGCLAEALLNFLASLGWNDGTEQEIFSREELLAKFALNRVQKSGARFDEKRLEWMNGQHIAKLPEQQLLQQIDQDDLWANAKKASAGDTKKLVELAKLRMRTLADIDRLTIWFFEEPKQDSIDQLLIGAKIDNTTARQMLDAAKTELEASDFSEADIKDRLNGLLTKLDTKPAVLFSAIRIAVTGQAYSPELFGSLSVLGKEKTIARLEQAVSALL